MLKIIIRGAWLALFCVFLSAASGCDTVETAFDCNTVCNRYRDCYQSDYDVGACRSRCRASAEHDPNTRAKADACESCLDGKSCVAATFDCTTECSGIVP